MTATASETPRDDRAPRHLSISNEHATPVEIVEASRTLLGAITLDPASCVLAQTRVRATSWFGLDHPNPLYQDALTLRWTSCGEPSDVFHNPPGGKIGGESSAKAFWFKLAEEYVAGRVRSAVFLGFSVEILQTTQITKKTPAWAKLPIPLDFPICVPSRRLKFDKMVPRCTLCGRFIDPERAKLLKHAIDPDLCSPNVPLTPKAFNAVVAAGRRPTSINGNPIEDGETFFDNEPRCPRNGIEHWGPLDFCTGDAPPHSNVLVYLPPRDLDERAARTRFQEAFAAIGRVR